MSSSLVFSLSCILFLTVLTVQSVYTPYLYDDGKGGQEHCCVVPVRSSFCLAKPITRSLVQVNKECSRIEKPRRRRLETKNQTKDDYFDKITGRLNVKRVHENDNRIYIELQKPLEKDILQNDLVCLTATDKQNTMNLDKCFVELVEESDEDDYEKPVRRRGHRSKHHKRSIDKDEDDDDDDDDDQKIEQDETKNEVQRIALDESIQVLEGEGLSFIRKYQLDRNQIRPKTKYQRRCWSWYRHQVRRLRKNSSKKSISCFRLNQRTESCINELFSYQKQHLPETSFTIGSKLYCKNEQGYNKFLGEYQRGKICFDQHDIITFERKFTDITRLSDKNQNRDTLEFIEKDKKLFAEFEDDCHGQTHLVEETVE